MAKPPDLKAELWRELRDGRGVHEAELRYPGWHLDGLCEGGKVYVDPAPSIVETLLHELLHRARPRWGERRVDAEAKRMLRQMSTQEVRRWYRTYQRVKQSRVTPVRLGDE